MKTFATIGAIFGLIIAWNTNWLNGTGASMDSLGGPVYWFLIFLFGAPIVMGICGVIGGVIGAVIGGILTASDQEALEKSEAEKRAQYEREKEQWESDRVDAMRQDLAAVNEFKQDNAVIKELLNIIKNLLQEHYENGPVYRKYCNLPAVCQLYEYFESGRFKEFDKAYNQYELEVRLDKIIDNSEEALVLLGQTRDNQFLLYQGLQDIKASVDTTNATLMYCAERLDSIGYTLEITALCSQQTALATMLLSQIQFYKNRHNLPFPFHVYEGYLLGVDTHILARKKRLSK